MKLMQLLVVTLLTAGAVQAAPIEEVMTINSGAIYYYGHGPIAPPYVFGSDGVDAYIRFPADSAFKDAGLDWVPWCLDPNGGPASYARVSVQRSRPASPNDDLIERARTIADSEGLRGMLRAERLARIYRESGLVDSAKAMQSANGPIVAIYFKNAAPIMSIVDDVQRPGRPITSAERVGQDIARVARSLEVNRMVIVDYGIELSVDPRMIPQIRQELSDLKSGQPPCLIKNREIVQRFRRPSVSLHTLVHGDK